MKKKITNSCDHKAKTRQQQCAQDWRVVRRSCWVLVSRPALCHVPPGAEWAGSTPYSRTEGVTRGHHGKSHHRIKRQCLMWWHRQCLMWWHRWIWVEGHRVGRWSILSTENEDCLLSCCVYRKEGNTGQQVAVGQPSLSHQPWIHSVSQAFLCKRLLTLLITPPPPRYLTCCAVRVFALLTSLSNKIIKCCSTRHQNSS